MAQRLLYTVGIVPGILAISGATAHAALSISDKATQNVSCNTGMCIATAKKAVLNATDLTNMLAASAVTVQSGTDAQDITVDAPFTWTSANALTLDSYRSITVDKPVSNAGPASLTLTTNDGGVGGDLSFLGKGSIGFLSTSNALAINGNAYTLVNSVATLASAVTANPSGFYALASNYDASVDGHYHAAPVATTFTGRLQGLGNTISRLKISAPKDTSVGLFATVDTSGVVASIRISHASIVAKTNSLVGVLIGRSFGNVFNASSSGSIKTGGGKEGGTNVGGLVGVNAGVVDGSSSSVAVNVSSNSQIASATAGGLIGGNYGITLRSFATGAIAINGSAVVSPGGGLVGFNDGNVENCYSMGSANVGQSSAAGGLVGQGAVSIASSYSTGLVSGGDGSNMGGFIGIDEGTDLSHNYWNLDTSGISDPKQGAGNIQHDKGIKGLTDDQLKSGLPAGFDPAVWAQSPTINNDYPYLIANPPVK